MPKYCVNKKVQPNGDHEVHKYSCDRLPEEENRLYLGDFDNCFHAVMEAKKYFAQSNGCYYCSRECHTT